ncbi:MAG: SpoIIE family protein phosphatase [Deltaproteobacteria bacterium]|nr:SpoIIE family protein phosphatase [Deltaproteobacteria bacterium]
MSDARTQNVGSMRLADGYQHALKAADILFGGFMFLMVGLAGIGVHQGVAPVTDLILILGFLVVNIVVGEVGRRLDRPFLMEGVRVCVGGGTALAAYLMVAGPLGPWWPGFVILSLGGSIGFGLLTQKPHGGRAVVAVYFFAYLFASIAMQSPIDWYQIGIEGGLIAMLGLMFAEIMSLLGQTLQQEHERSLDLQAARDALFAEVEVAQAIQTLLLPRDPKIPEHEVAGRMVTATEVGGDYYDVIDTSSGRSLVAIGDVSGHGVTSGLTMMMARTSLVGAVEAIPDAPIPVLYRVLNRCIRQNLARMNLSMYMTFALLEHHGRGRFTAVGRHLPLYIYRRASEAIEEIELSGMWLGILDDLEPDQLQETHFELAPGDLLFLFTDGIVEQFVGEEMFGYDRLRELVRQHGAAGSSQVIDEVLGGLRAFSSEQEDDVTMLVVTHTGDVQQAMALSNGAAA